MACTSIVALLLASLPIASCAPLKVLPLGDSITFGCGDGCNGLGCGDQCAVLRPSCQSGYRSLLWRMLSPNSTTSQEWDFVGTQHNGPDDIDGDHEGHPGWRSQGIQGISDKWLPLKPDVIMLHIGTNNMGVGLESAATALQNLGSLLNVTFRSLPKVRLLLATIIGSSKVAYGGGKHKEYNAGVEQFVVDYKGKGFTIELVDMAKESGLGQYCDSGNCCLPGIHPTGKGYDLMAPVWYKHLTGKDIVVV